MKIFKRNAVILTVLLFVCVAVYLNWSYNRGQELDALGNLADPEATGDVLSPEDGEDGTGEAGLYYGGDGANAGTAMSEYFATARLTRQQARDNAIAILQEAAGAEDASQEVVDQVLRDISAMANYTAMEAQIENILMAKDFEECVVIMSAAGVNVAVPAPVEGLSTSAVARITDVVVTESGLPAGLIKIIPVK